MGHRCSMDHSRASIFGHDSGLLLVMLGGPQIGQGVGVLVYHSSEMKKTSQFSVA